MKIPKRSPYPGALLQHMKSEKKMSSKALAKHERSESKSEEVAEKKLRPAQERKEMKKKLNKGRKALKK
jgi:hypothetical protein